jgi:hypothetical protein
MGTGLLGLLERVPTMIFLPPASSTKWGRKQARIFPPGVRKRKPAQSWVFWRRAYREVLPKVMKLLRSRLREP